MSVFFLKNYCFNYFILWVIERMFWLEWLVPHVDHDRIGSTKEYDLKIHYEFFNFFNLVSKKEVVSKKVMNLDMSML